MRPTPAYRRRHVETLAQRLVEPRRFIQVVAGPRQVGKTTLVRQAVWAADVPWHYASADDPALRDRVWLETMWQAGRVMAAGNRPAPDPVLVLDEIQKIPGWSETVKRLWDEDTASGVGVKVVVLGSSPLLVQRGLSESLAGRFEMLRLGHWSFGEMRDAFGWRLEDYLAYGGYPGSAALITDPERWRAYILDSLVETTLSRDILLQTRVDKPALLRHLFGIACDYSAQIVSYTKLLGELHDAGNTTTLAHYLQLLGDAGMVTGLSKYSGSSVRRRGSIPKLLALNTALVTAMSARTADSITADRAARGRIVETAVGAHLVASAAGDEHVGYWREGSVEVDYVVSGPRGLLAIEVASGRPKPTLRGLDAFGRRFRTSRKLLIGGQGLPLETALSIPAGDLISAA